MNVQFGGCCALKFAGQPSEQQAAQAQQKPALRPEPEARLHQPLQGDKVQFSGCCG